MTRSDRFDMTVRGEQATHYEKIREQIEESIGHEVSRPFVLSILMSRWDDQEETGDLLDRHDGTH